MTSAATVVGHLPLIFANGPGAGARNSISIMLVSGMIIGTAFTLFVVPAIYMLVARERKPVEVLEMELAFAMAQSSNGHGHIHSQKEGIRVSVA
jgi:multidrug efflux pump